MKKETSFQFEHLKDIKRNIQQLCVNSGIVSCASDNYLIRFRYDSPESSYNEIRLPLENEKIAKLFVDPTSSHVILSSKSNNNYYYSKLSNKIKVIKEAKDTKIESVGWNELNSNENCTQNILIGTSSGELIETKLSSNVGIDGYWKTITKYETKVTNILFGNYPDSNGSKYFLIVTTPTDIYPYFFNLGNCSKSNHMFMTEFERINSQPQGSKCTTFPLNIGFSHLDVYYKNDSTFPKFLSWLMGVGVYYAPFASSSSEAETTLFVRPKLLSFNTNSQNSKPVSVSNTEFHVIIQYNDYIDFVCTLNEESVFQKKLEDLDLLSLQGSQMYDSKSDQFLGISKDRTNGTILCYTSMKVFRIKYDQETKYLWKSLLELGNFDLAFKFCHNDNERDFVQIKEADCLYSKGKYIESAIIYSQTSLSFEEVTLKYVDLDDKSALRTYFIEYSERKKGTNQKSSNQIKRGGGGGCLQNTYDAMCIWMMELLFDQINNDPMNYFQNNESSLKNNLSNHKHKNLSNQIVKTINKQYRQFVEQPSVINSLKRNKAMMYEKIRCYGDSYQAKLFAEIIEDNEKMMECLIENGETEEALKILQKEKSSKLHYIYGKKLLKNHPNEIIDLWISMSTKLDTKRILHYLQNVPDSISKRFIKHMILNKDCDIEEVHNLYILLCARLSALSGGSINSEHTDDLLYYLNKEGNDPLMTKYDAQLALRNCSEWNNLAGSVFLLCLMNKYQSAVELALSKKNLNLAKQIVSQSNGDDEIKKNLWLQIARFMILENEKIEEVCELIRNQNVLKLEDVLPFLPDKVKIEHFSDAICSSLDFYSKHIENLKKDMELSTQCSNRLREDYNRMKQKPIVVPENSVCAYCTESLTIRPFCLFPCKHFFHIHCLERIVVPMLDQNSLQALIDAKNKLFSAPEDNSAKKQYYDTISGDCCYCGTIAIENIDCPLITRNEFDSEIEAWKI